MAGDVKRNELHPTHCLPRAKKEGRGHLKIFLGAAPGVGKTYAMLSSARAEKGGRTRCRCRPDRNAWPARNRAIDRGFRNSSTQANDLSQPGHEGVRSRRRAGAPAATCCSSTNMPTPTSRQPPSETMAGYRRTAGGRHRRLDHAQHPAPREPQRCRPEDHQDAGPRNGARTWFSTRPTRSCSSISRRTNCSSDSPKEKSMSGHRGARG